MQEISILPSSALALCRGLDTHKGHFGSVAVIGGAEGMCGAALLAGRAALLLGAGKVWVGLLDARLSVDILQPELMLSPAETLLSQHQPSHILAGMGMGISPEAAQLLLRCMDTPAPLLLDADALNLIATDTTLQAQLARRSAPTVLTPHPSEAARLLGISTAAVQADRLAATRALIGRYQCHIVLKGHGTLVGVGADELTINRSGNAALSSAGQGDVLSGIIMSLCAQGLALIDAARCGVYLHGRAADDWLASHPAGIGLTASETIMLARQALNKTLSTISNT
ncbi:NAD(P)H-hydrate dehydratase [Chitinibacter sp. FCG-7]|uniref:ADP-dependent (S)-NAD(P)H-hydrate dehydratase n=1 Tax=Chitinibacter mangrovi TaxID=3153927 RepID=A0AAU7FB23_9NEIS